MPVTDNFCGELDSVNMPLDGAALIEAAAGTGKTYNIQNIVARLIVEKNFPIETLAVVTFTNPAAKELAGRLRKVLELLTGVLNNCSNASEKDQERARKLLDRFTGCGISHSEQKERLEAALRNIDDCRVSTIHGFCARLLSEYAFESSMTFQTRLEKNIKGIISKLIKDFCRSKRYSQINLPGWDNLEFGTFTNMVNDLQARHNAKLLRTRPTYDSEDAIYAHLAKLQQKFINLPDKEKKLDDLRNRLVSISSQDGNQVLDDLQQSLFTSLPAANADWQEWSEFLKNFRTRRFANKGSKDKKRGGAANKEFVNYFISTEELFTIAEDYCLTLEVDCPVFLKLQAIEFVDVYLRKLKENENFHDYNDLLSEADNALKDMQFRRFVQQKFNAGIIDEFQDTDPLQYSIFKAIFMDRPDKRLIMVGDPRQAIYAFRGGDIATYLTARQECELNAGKKYTLTTNYRSSGEMIDSFNTFFDHNDPFFSPDIVFEEVKKPDDLLPGIRFDGQSVEHPLSVVYMADETSSDPIYDLCAEEISRMLASGKYEIPNEDEATKKEQPFRRITPGDIAVLAYTNPVLDTIRTALAKYNIPAIGERKGGIWNSNEARALADFMQAVLENTNTVLVREALLSEICGVDLTELNLESAEGAEKMFYWQSRFIELAECWQNRGTAAFITGMFKTFSLKTRLTVQTGGERMLSNYTQLGDLLAAAELTGKLSPHGVLKYLREKISGNSDEEFEMLESDRHAVRLLTIHKSKGLQFPIVFLPQLSSRQALSQKGLRFYHENSDLYCDIEESTPEATTLAAIEDMQEIMRLVYVAVTRACYFCRMVFSKNPGSKKSPMSWLFMSSRHDENLVHNELLHRNFVGNSVNVPDFNSESGIPLTLQQPGIFDEFEPRFYLPGLTSEINEPPAVKTPHSSRYMVSYSTLNELGKKQNIYSEEEELSDRDNIEENENSSGEIPDYSDHSAADKNSSIQQGGIWDIPHGAAIGNAWHKVLEETDFTQGIDVDYLKNIMASYGFAKDEYVKSSLAMFNNLLDYQLPCGMKLKELTCERRLTELEFLIASPNGFKFKSITDAVNEYVQSQFNAQIIPAGFLNLQKGFFNGIVDMIFEYNGKLYIIDWKSNAFGAVKEEFFGARLEAQMIKKRYVLQYLCYLAALLKFLEQRLQKKVDEALYNEYVGGVYYIFLRGMVFEQPGGVFSAQVPYKTVRALADVISCGKEF